MKRLFCLSISFLIIQGLLKSQTNTFPNSGNVGVGTTSPSYPLHVTTTSSSSGFHPGIYAASDQSGASTSNVTGIVGTSSLTHSSGNVALGIGLSGSVSFSGNGTATDIRPITSGGYLSNSASATNWICYNAGFSTYNSATVTNGYGLLINAFPSGVTNKFGIYVNDANAFNYFGGSVGIGTTSPGSFKLAVEGKIGAREIQVTLTTPWPDYVFDKKYKIMSLNELEIFIQNHKHLPNIPSLEDVKKKTGFELGEMTIKLLEKVEELTLYIIELKKDNDNIRKELERIKQ